jgi:hypothetical protein
MHGTRVALIVTSVAIGLALGNAPDIAEAQPAIDAVRDRSVIEDGVCEFASESEHGASGITPIVVGLNLDCEILMNIDGVDVRLRSSQRGACDRGWDLPGKGQRVSRTYGSGAISVRADYSVIDACFVGDRCEYIKFEATFRISRGSATRSIRAKGQCSW